MKILLVGRMLPYNAEFFYRKAFNSLGHETCVLDSYQGVRYPFLSRTMASRVSLFRPLERHFPVNRKLPEYADRYDPDAILIFKGEFIDTAVLESLSENYPLYLLYPDNYRFNPLLKGRLHLFRKVFTAANSVDGYYQLGARSVVTVPWACDPEFHRKLSIERKYKFTFIGTGYIERRKIVRKLNGVEVFGNFWFGLGKARHGPVFGDDYVKTINQSQISLNLQGNGAIYADSPTMRTFELAGSGGFQISDYMSSVKRYFPEIVTFRDVNELRELMEYYGDAAEEGEIIAEKLMERTVKSFKYVDSANLILDNI